MFIAKLQRSVATSKENKQVLIYNQAKTLIVEIDLTPKLDKMFGENDKIFAKCSISPKNELVIGDLVKQQDW